MSQRFVTNTKGNETSSFGGGELTIDAWGTQKVSNPLSLFHSMFTFDIPPQLWVLYENGTELYDITSSTKNISQNGMLYMKSGSTTNDVSLLESRRHPRYQPNRGHLYSASIFLPNPTSGQADFGLIVNDENGAFFRRKEDGKLYACILNDSVLTHEEEIDIRLPLDLTKGNVYDIQMQWRGVGNIKFYIGNPFTGYPELVHTIKNLNSLQNLSVQNPALSAGFKLTNVSGNEAELKCGCVDITSEGGKNETEQFASSVSTLAATYSTGDPILTIRSPLTIGGKVNTRDLRLARISVNADKKSSVALYITRDSTAFTGGTWSAIGNGSYVEESKDVTSVNLGKMKYITSFNVEANSTERVGNPSASIDFYIVHGDYVCLVCEDGSTATLVGIIDWGEEI